MKPWQIPVTRRATLRLIGATVAGTTLASMGGLSYATGVFASSPDVTETVATTPESQPVVPFSGAGLFDVDPDQHNVSQDPNIVIHGDVAALPEDMEV